MNFNRKRSGTEKAEAIPVLMYHWFFDLTVGRGPDDESRNWISAQNFEEQMKYLHDHDYYYASLEELKDWIDGRIDLPRKTVILTDDDAFITFFTIAMPVFQKYRIPFTSFMPTSLGREKPQTFHDYKDEPYVTFESHSDTLHKNWDICFGKNVEELDEDIRRSVSHIGNHEVFAYPFGQFTDEYIEALKKNDFKLAFTTKEGKVRRGMDHYRLPRVRMSKDMSLNDFILAIGGEPEAAENEAQHENPIRRLFHRIWSI